MGLLVGVADSPPEGESPPAALGPAPLLRDLRYTSGSVRCEPVDDLRPVDAAADRDQAGESSGGGASSTALAAAAEGGEELRRMKSTNSSSRCDDRALDARLGLPLPGADAGATSGVWGLSWPAGAGGGGRPSSSSRSRACASALAFRSRGESPLYSPSTTTRPGLAAAGAGAARGAAAGGAAPPAGAPVPAAAAAAEEKQTPISGSVDVYGLET